LTDSGDWPDVTTYGWAARRRHHSMTSPAALSRPDAIRTLPAAHG